MKTVFVLIVVTLLMGCSTQVDYDRCMTIGSTKDIQVSYLGNGITVQYLESIVTTGDIYFYVDEERLEGVTDNMVIAIPDSILYVDSKPFDRLAVYFSRDAAGRLYMQIIRVGGNLCMSVGGTLEIKTFTVRW